jgi:multidrug efflux system outer membrane protein
MRALTALASVAVLLGGCSMIPKYNRPAAPVPPEFPSPPGGAAATAADTPWAQFFTDERLRRVVEMALANNRELRVATLAIERAQAVHRIQRAELFPQVGVQASGDRTRVPEKLAPDGVDYTAEQYAVVGTASWELDLFGRIRSLKASALEQYLATQHARRAAQVSLVAATAATYLGVAADAESLALARSTFESQRGTLDLLRASRDAGIANDLAVQQAVTQVEVARAAIAHWTGRLAVDRDALDVLAGTRVPAELLPERVTAVSDARVLSPGLPSDVLLSRPDILAAEHQLRAANANIGAARAAFFPRISLTGGVGTTSRELSDLFGSGARTWSFTPLITVPIFTGGALQANLRVTKVDRDIAVAQYEKAIQVAFAEVSDGLALRSALLDQRVAEEALVQALDATHRLSMARYEAGIDSYLAVLVAQQGLFRGQEALVDVRRAEQANLVGLYKALGGGGA